MSIYLGLHPGHPNSINACVSAQEPHRLCQRYLEKAPEIGCYPLCLGIAWAPHSTCHLVTAAEDSQALIWDVHQIPRPVDDPILAYTAAGEVIGDSVI